jgi:hypothetical protein
MIRKIATIVVSGMLAFAPLVVSAQIIPGTHLTGVINQEINSKSANVGDGFTITDVHSENRHIDGAKIYGHVADVQRAGQGRPGKISLAYDKLYAASGNVYSLSGTSTVSVQADTKNNTLKEVGGAVGGMIVGNILGKMVGTNLGGLAGAGGGYMLAKNNKENVTIPKNSTVVVEINRSLRQSR